MQKENIDYGWERMSMEGVNRPSIMSKVIPQTTIIKFEPSNVKNLMRSRQLPPKWHRLDANHGYYMCPKTLKQP